MSEPNDLLERLRDLVAWDPGDGDDEGFSLLREAADRIEELETALPWIAGSPSGKERSEMVARLLGEDSDHE